VHPQSRDRDSLIDEYAAVAAPAQLARARRPSRRRDLKLARTFAITGDLHGLRVLDYGCSIGMIALACAEREAASPIGDTVTIEQNTGRGSGRPTHRRRPSS
jgi:2-polyprenyl-3-methyl-5-hydroxy-6-metoxy-1,4-benzoquinol methylase